MLKFVFIFLTYCSILDGSMPVVLITGASEGIGLATAEYLADKGFCVYGTIIENEKKPLSDKIKFEYLDVTSTSSIEYVTNKIIKAEGGLDILINNAEFGLAGSIECLTIKEIKELMDVNFYGPIRMCQAVLPQMRRQNYGHIINISNEHGVSGLPFGSIYSASKAALEAISEALSIEVQPWNIIVSIIEPGQTITPHTVKIGSRHVEGVAHYFINNVFDALKNKKNEYNEHQEPEDIARLIYKVIKEINPSLRYQTSASGEEKISKAKRSFRGFLYSLLQ